MQRKCGSRLLKIYNILNSWLKGSRRRYFFYLFLKIFENIRQLFFVAGMNSVSHPYFVELPLQMLGKSNENTLWHLNSAKPMQNDKEGQVLWEWRKGSKPYHPLFINLLSTFIKCEPLKKWEIWSCKGNKNYCFPWGHSCYNVLALCNDEFF